MAANDRASTQDFAYPLRVVQFHPSVAVLGTHLTKPTGPKNFHGMDPDLEVLDEGAAAEQHDGRRYELRFFPFAMGLVDEEPDAEEPPVREWVHPEARTSGPVAAGCRPGAATFG